MVMHGACITRGGRFASIVKAIPFASISSRSSGVQFVGQGLQEQDVLMESKRADVWNVAGQESVNT